MNVHPAAELFPLLKGDDFDGLVRDIAENGLREPIVTHEGQILDGRNRARACEQAGVEPRFETYEGDDPVAYVVSKNLHRRHLSETQRAAIAAKLANMPLGGNFYADNRRSNSVTGQISLKDASKKLNVARSTTIQARRIYREGTPDEIEAMENGQASAYGLEQKIKARTEKPKRRNKQLEGFHINLAQLLTITRHMQQVELGELEAEDIQRFSNDLAEAQSNLRKFCRKFKETYQ